MKEMSPIRIVSGEGLDYSIYLSPVVAEVSSAVDEMLRATIDPEQSISGHMAVLDSEVDGLRMAINCGEPATVVREECVAAIARLVQIYNAVAGREVAEHREADPEQEA